MSLFEDLEVSWEDIGDFEERFEAHIDGLVVGDELALKVCQTQASEGDFGERHAALRVCCRQNRKDLVLGILGEFDPEDTENIQAISEASNTSFRKTGNNNGGPHIARVFKPASTIATASYTPACLLENLEAVQSLHKVRQFAYEELVIRHGLDLPFEVDMFVIKQKQILVNIAEWVCANESRFQAGAWYFAGQLMPT